MSHGYTAKEIMISILIEFHTRKDESVERELNQLGVTLLKRPYQFVGMAGGSELWMGNCPLSVLQENKLSAITSIKFAWVALESSIKTILSGSKKD